MSEEADGQTPHKREYAVSMLDDGNLLLEITDWSVSMRLLFTPESMHDLAEQMLSSLDKYWKIWTGVDEGSDN